MSRGRKKTSSGHCGGASVIGEIFCGVRESRDAHLCPAQKTIVALRRELAAERTRTHPRKSKACCLRNIGPVLDSRDVSQSDQFETIRIVKELRDHFEGIGGESHPANGSYIFENIDISLMLVSQTAKVAGFWGSGEGTSGFAVTIINLGGLEP
jgi:hypothetical protein